MQIVVIERQDLALKTNEIELAVFGERYTNEVAVVFEVCMSAFNPSCVAAD